MSQQIVPVKREPIGQYGVVIVFA